jgi:hypothetical protein
VPLLQFDFNENCRVLSSFSKLVLYRNMGNISCSFTLHTTLKQSVSDSMKIHSVRLELLHSTDGQTPKPVDAFLQLSVSNSAKKG